MLWLWVPAALLLFVMAGVQFHRLARGRTPRNDRFMMVAAVLMAIITVLLYGEILTA
ncbi:hypothetical protein [Aeromicrobium sp. Root472D3]|uniref:hypothetical protein n=1 Tax=Aeromicrobium sp. Root472D3 TaxID=1736540 RepID=UPI000AC155F6|nr:hypothetical protein [Aeromicrobium sp. Root472D3]